MYQHSEMTFLKVFKLMDLICLTIQSVDGGWVIQGTEMQNETIEDPQGNFLR